MNLDLRSLLHFAIVAEEQSVTGAARRLGLAQPWLSQRIRALEARLGFPLFNRSGRTIELTAEGSTLYAVARALPPLAREISELADELSTSSRQSVKIGAPPYSNRIAIVNDLLGGLGTAYGNACIALEVGWSAHLVDRVRKRELDATFALSPFATEGLDVIDVALVERLFVLEGHDDQSSITIDDLKGLAVAVFPREVNPALFDLAFAPLIEAAIDLAPVAFDGRPMRANVRADRLVTSFFGILGQNPHAAAKRLEGAPAVPLHFVCHAENTSPLIRAAQRILSTLASELPPEIQTNIV